MHLSDKKVPVYNAHSESTGFSSNRNEFNSINDIGIQGKFPPKIE